MENRLKKFFKGKNKILWAIINNIKKMLRISILKCFLSQLNCLLK